MEIPDPVFRSYLLENFDKNDDGVLTIPEALTITEIDVCTDSIYSLRGIEKMSRLVRLTACGSEGYRGKLFEIDLSGNPLLEFFNLNDNFIASLDLSGLPNLQDILFRHESACVHRLFAQYAVRVHLYEQHSTA